MKKHKHETVTLNGKVLSLSVCPHGRIEGIVLTDHTFIKISPHHRGRDALETLARGDILAVQGDMTHKKPNRMLHHAVVTRDSEVIFDHSENEKRKKPEEKLSYAKFSVKGKVISIGSKPEGKIDRVLLRDGTSIHLSKELQEEVAEVEVGDHVRVVGRGREFPNGTFIKATEFHVIR